MRNIKNRFISTLAVIAILLSLIVPVSATPSTNYTLTGNQAEDIVRVALAQKGKTRDQLGYKNDWCAYFVCWAGRTAGADFPQSDLGYPVDIARWFVNNGKGTFYCFRDGNYNDIIKWGVTQPNNIVRTTRESFAPKKGDLICYLWSYHVGTYNWSHIGIVTADYTGNGLVSTVEGNVGNRVGTFNQRYNSEVIGIIRPNYANNSTSSNPGATLTLNSSSYELKPGEQATINFTFTGAADIVDCSFSDNSICEYADGGWNPGQHNGFMSFKAKSPGTATVTVFLKDKNKKVLASKAITVTVKSTTTLSANASDITLDLAGKNSQGVTLTLGGYLDNCSLRTSWSNSNIATDQWDNYQGGTIVHAIITGKAPGTTTITYSLIDNNTQKPLATKTITVTVKAPSYTIQYNANGGTNAPASQTKAYQKVLTLSNAQPTRVGYTFSGWSTSPNGSVQYRPGDQYSADKNLTLYAVWLSDNSSSTAVTSPDVLQVYWVYQSGTSSTGGKYLGVEKGQENTKSAPVYATALNKSEKNQMIVLTKYSDDWYYIHFLGYEGAHNGRDFVLDAGNSECVGQYTRIDGKENQLWALIPSSSGGFLFQNKNGKYLTFNQSTGGYVMAEAKNNTTQVFQFYLAPNATVPEFLKSLQTG